YNSILAWPGEPYIVPKNAANVIGGMEVRRCIVSKANDPFFAREISASMPVSRGSEGNELSSALQAAVGAGEAAGDGLFNYFYKDWYTDLTNAARDAMGELLTNRITPEQFAERVQQAADTVKADNSIPKYTHS